MPALRRRASTIPIVMLLTVVWTGPIDAQLGPTFSDVRVSYAYPGTYRNIEQIDFGNFTFHNFDEKGKPNGEFALRNGGLKIDYATGGGDSLRLDSTHILPMTAGTQRQDALVLYERDSVGGSSGQEGIAQLFELDGNRLRVLQQISWDLHYGGPYQPFEKLFDEKAEILTFPSAHYLPGDAHCCVSAIDVVTMRWNGLRFVRTSIRTELSDYGKDKGKQLPDRNSR